MYSNNVNKYQISTKDQAEITRSVSKSEIQTDDKNKSNSEENEQPPMLPPRPKNSS